MKKKGVPLENIHEFTMEDDFKKQDFEKDVKKYFSFYMNNKGKHIFLIDEIQYVKNAGKLLKLIYDTMEVKIIVTGSSSLDLNNIGEFLVGRAIFLICIHLILKNFYILGIRKCMIIIEKKK